MSNPIGVAWNPRAHPFTRPPRLSYQNYTPSSAGMKDATPRGDAGDIGAVLGGALGPVGSAIGRAVGNAASKDEVELGWIRTSKELTDVKQPYGITFHYNPTDVQIGLASSSDLVLGQDVAPHTAIPLTAGQSGNATVEFNLYLNRIYDMSATEKSYPTPLGKSPLGENHWSMIRKLGTQWDVEFLLRAINPDPKKSSILDYKSADIGAMPPGPVDVSLGPLMWRGVITSLSINHIMFTPEYVPMFTTIRVSLLRIMTADGGGDGSAASGEDGEDPEESSTNTPTDSASAESDVAKKKAASTNPAKKKAPGGKMIQLPG